MYGVILAAGVGSRLRPMTNDKPKCLVTTAGKAIIQYQIDAYKEAGVREIFIIVGYEGEAIKDYCKHIKDISIKIIDNQDYENTNNMYSLYLAREYVDGKPFILNNADLSIDSSIVKKLLSFEASDAVAVDTGIFNDESMKVTVRDNGTISGISKAVAEKDSFACSIDFYKFSGKSSSIFFKKIKEIIEVDKNLKDWTEVAMHKLFSTQEMSFYPCDIAGLDWVEIDNYQDLAISDRKFSNFDKSVKNIDNFLFDLDGTVYLGKDVIPGAVESVNQIRKMGKSVFFFSNNSSKNKKDYVKRLRKIGIDCIDGDIILSTDGLIGYLKENNIEKVHVLGTESLKSTIRDFGFDVDADNPEYVVIGYDTELTYQKLVDACNYINKGVDILATHCDVFCPTENGPVPDVGAMLEMIRLTTGKTAKLIFGKPSVSMLKPLVDNLKIDLTRTVIIGDRLHTDIRMAKEAKCLSLLVLSGETTRDQLETAAIKPDFVLTTVADIFNS